MKYLLFCILLTAISCQKTETCSVMTECTDECLFMLSERPATTRFISCFDSWGVVYIDEGLTIGLIVDNMSSSLQEENLEVNLCGYARTNEIPMEFPDPTIGAVYQFEAVMLELD